MPVRMKGYSSSARDRRVRRHAKRHARKGIRALQEWVVKKLIGAKMIVDVISNALHHRLEQDSQPDPRVALWKQEKADAEERLTHHSSRWLLWCSFVFLLVVEFAGISQLLAGQ